MKNIFYFSGLQDGGILSVIVAFAVVWAVAGLGCVCEAVSANQYDSSKCWDNYTYTHTKSCSCELKPKDRIS